MLAKKDTFTLAGSEDDFLKLMNERPGLQASDVFCAPPGIVERHFMAKATNRMKIPHSPEALRPEALLTPAQAGYLEAHRKAMRGQRGENTFCVDIGKTDPMRSALTYLPVLTKNSVIWSEVHRREAIVARH